MLANGWRGIELLVHALRDTREARQRLKRLCSGSTAEADATRLGMWVVQSLVDAVDGANAGVGFAEFGDPLVACFGLKDGPQHIHGLFAFAWANGQVKRQ